MDTPVDHRVEKVVHIMRADLSKELSLADLAQSVNLSVWRLSHVFRSEIGISPIQYLKVLRIERARHLLETSFLSIKEITYSVGLKDESHFVRDFKKTHRVSPTSYRVLFNSGKLRTSDHEDEPPPKSRKSMTAIGESILLPILTIFCSILATLDAVV
jgi:transcriptional regulator GlxA family with amidase domain